MNGGWGLPTALQGKVPAAPALAPQIIAGADWRECCRPAAPEHDKKSRSLKSLEEHNRLGVPRGDGAVQTFPRTSTGLPSHLSCLEEQRRLGGCRHLGAWRGGSSGKASTCFLILNQT